MTATADRLVGTGSPPYNAKSKLEEIGAEVEALWVASATRLSSVGGTGDAITANANPTLNAYAADNKFVLVSGAGNTGAVTININSLGLRNLKSAAGAALTSGQLVSGTAYLLWDDGTDIRVIAGILQEVPTSGAMELIYSQSVSGSPSTVAFVNGSNGVTFDDTDYDRFLIVIDDLKISADDKDIHIEIGTGATPTWQTGSSAYIWALSIVGSSDDTFTDKDASDPGIYVTDKSHSGYALGSATGESLNGRIEFSNPEATNFPKFSIDVTYDASNDRILRATGSGRYNTAQAITGVRLVAESGNTFASGRVSLYGIRKA